MIKLFTAFSCAAFLCAFGASCLGRTTIVVPERGEKASSFETRSDAAGRVFLDLSGSVKEIRYRHFSIRNPHDPRFAVLVMENTPDLAQWRESSFSNRFYFLAKVARDRLPFIVRDSAELREYYERIYKKAPLVIRFHIELAEREGQTVVVFESRTRQSDGRLTLVNGFACLDPADPDFVIEASCTVSGYEKELDAPEIKNLDKLFLDSVHIGVPE